MWCSNGHDKSDLNGGSFLSSQIFFFPKGMFCFVCLFLFLSDYWTPTIVPKTNGWISEAMSWVFHFLSYVFSLLNMALPVQPSSLLSHMCCFWKWGTCSETGRDDRLADLGECCKEPTCRGRAVMRLLLKWQKTTWLDGLCFRVTSPWMVTVLCRWEAVMSLTEKSIKKFPGHGLAC